MENRTSSFIDLHSQNDSDYDLVDFYSSNERSYDFNLNGTGHQNGDERSLTVFDFGFNLLVRAGRMTYLTNPYATIYTKIDDVPNYEHEVRKRN